MRDMPAIKNKLAQRKPTKLIEFIKSSTKDICIKIPAEKARENHRNLCVGFLINNPNRPPIVVAIPAKNDKKIAYITIGSIYILFHSMHLTKLKEVVFKSYIRYLGSTKGL